MKLLAFFLASAIWAQTRPAPPAPASIAPVPSGAALGQKETEQLATRMLQLMESTAVASPGLVRASEPTRQNADMTFTAIQRTPQSPALIFQFMNQIKAYLALSDSISRPYPFPPTADQQYSELREDLQRMQQHFEAILQVQNVTTEKRDADPNDVKHYVDANSRLLAPGKVPRVVFLGDAATESWRLNEYFNGRDFVNRGIADQTTAQMLGRFERDVLALNPSGVVIEGGISDIIHGLSAGQTEDNLAMMAELAKGRGMKVAIASILPVSDYHKNVDPRYEMTKSARPAVIQQINTWIADYCRAGNFVYVDYYAALVDSQGQMQADASDDGLTPNGKGYRLMSPIVVEAVGKLFGPPPTQQPPEQPAQPRRRFFPLGR